MSYGLYIPPPAPEPRSRLGTALFVAGLFVFCLVLVTAGLALFQIIHASLEPGGLDGMRFPL